MFIENIINSSETFINPNNFDPENFNPDNFKNKFAHMAFGQGPRACPGIDKIFIYLFWKSNFLQTSGTRYAYLAVKIFMVKFFQSYRVIPSEKTNMGVAEVKGNINK